MKSYDKSSWGPGPWQNEPDWEEFEYKGLHCFLRRSDSGAWNGYIVILLPSVWDRGDHENQYQDLQVHGGITFAKYGTYKENNKNILMLGFDCLHNNDFSPIPQYEMADEILVVRKINSILALLENKNGLNKEKVYRTIDYARTELKKLVDQIVGN